MKLLRARATVSADEARAAKTSDWVFVAVIIGVLMTLLLGSLVLAGTILWFVVTRLRLMA